MSTDRINELHERASECYLSGDYEGAVSAWREVLALDPGNEQALGGVRMAAQFVRHDEPSYAAASAEVEVETELDRGLMVLDGLGTKTLLQADLTDGATDRKPEPRAEFDETLGEEPFDGWEIPEAPAVEEGAFGLDPVPEATQAAAEPVSRAASELKRRVEDLLVEAKANADAGERDEALSILARLSILDEDNAEAALLRSKLEAAGASDLDKIEQAIIEGVSAMEANRFDDAERHFREALELAPEHREATHYMDKIAERRLLGDEELLGDTSGDAAPSGGAVQHAIGIASSARTPASAASEPSPKVPRTTSTQPLDSEPRPARRGSRFAMPSPKALILVGVGAAVLLGAAIALPKLFHGSQPKEASAKTTVPQPKARPKPKASAAATAPGPESPEARERLVAEQLETARSLMAARDFGEAIIAFNKALALDPGNAAAKEGFADAAERYKAGKAVREAMENIRLAFRDGEFSSALRLAYRLPPDVDASYANGVKVTGWYNLAVVALRAGDCRSAQSNLDEALVIAPGDVEAKKLREFASRYAETVRDRAFLDRVEALSFRPLPAS